LTALLLQILSNFANDYGDFAKGTDIQAGRTDRMLASGKISKKSMQLALVTTALLAFISGLSLLFVSHLQLSTSYWFFIVLGILAIGAAITYTMGKYAYAYSGLGDLFVLVFFGFVSVCGIYFLHTGSLNKETIVAALGAGLLATAVLNVNNIRDIDADKSSNKNTLPVRMGEGVALIYHRFLIWLGTTFTILSFFMHLQAQLKQISPVEYAMVLGVFSPILLLMAGHTNKVYSAAALRQKEQKPLDEMRKPFNAELKNLSLTILLLTVIYWALSYLGS
ncbi:MAG: 1,4-dihydroxy-2-naphthoate octaprenyltransferase, partial [Bacteroidia bacterium]|nr:1,4-dihydroxy-2-naphthoate octaprenyltransferase [Bacteroidia bacterium]